MAKKPIRNLKVFVVEDSERFSNWIKGELEELEAVTVEEIGGEVDRTRQLIHQNKPDVITLDIRLANGSGMEILKDIRASKLDIKVIIFTNYPWQVFQKQCMELGADYFFDKMHDSDKLALAVKDIQGNKDSNGSFQHGKSVMI